MLASRRRFLPYLPPVVLAVVASAQFAVAHVAPLSPWKGGGFGMFSTQDKPRSRTLRVHLLTDEGAYVVVDGPGSESIRAWPRRAALRRAAREAVCGAWRLVPLDEVAEAPAPSPAWDWVYRSPTLRQRSALTGVAVPAAGAASGPGIRAARAVVVHVGLDAAASRIVPEVVAQETVTRAAAGCESP